MSPVFREYDIFESLKYPVCIIGMDGILTYANTSFLKFMKADNGDYRLDWDQPLFPEYRKRVAQSYLNARNGIHSQCFAIINSPDGSNIPIEIYLFPLIRDAAVYSILALMKVVDDRILSFDRSTLSIISDENFKYDNLHFEFSPMPIFRINESLEIFKCSHSLESFTGYTCDEIIDRQAMTFDSFFIYESERIKHSVNDIFSGDQPFQRIGEVKVATRIRKENIVNIVMYPIIQDNQITSVEITLEDITKIKELNERISSMNRVQVLSDITKGFLHSLNNSVNVIMSRTQLLEQITEKDSVTEGIRLIEKSAVDIIEQIRRVENFLGERGTLMDSKTEPLVDILEDAVEFARMQFKVEENERRRSVIIEKQYFSNVFIKTDTRLLREIFISIILKVADLIQKKGTLSLCLQTEKETILTVAVNKEGTTEDQQQPGIFSGIDIRQVAQKLKIRIIEEESADCYSLKAVLPFRQIVREREDEPIHGEFRLRDLDIIIVEDEQALQKIMFELFDQMGNRVFIYENGQEALDDFRKNPCDLVITDYDIKGITGIELSARVKEISEKTATILLSGWMLEDLSAYKNVVDLFMPKPFKLDDLIKNISRVMKEQRKKLT